jgi:hypothetical protein
MGEIAAACGISEAHLMKITHQLGLQGWLETDTRWPICCPERKLPDKRDLH